MIKKCCIIWSFNLQLVLSTISQWGVLTSSSAVQSSRMQRGSQYFQYQDKDEKTPTGQRHLGYSRFWTSSASGPWSQHRQLEVFRSGLGPASPLSLVASNILSLRMAARNPNALILCTTSDLRVSDGSKEGLAHGTCHTSL
ncbi:hypothetical protein EI94DRAFT_79720 [Lactarius quietus]|nr:hypothetical protein EI94DRAFT_79720 [Lactarius quietus]